MVEAAVFAVVFVGFFALRFVAATLFFFYILPEGTLCPCCNGETLHIESRFWRVMAPRFRSSWCPRCSWEGLLRRSAQPPAKTLRRPRTVRLSRRGSARFLWMSVLRALRGET